MKQYPNKEQVLQKIEVITRTIDDLIWMDSSTIDPIKYQKLLLPLIHAKNDLQTYVLHNMDFEPAPEPAPEPTAEDHIIQLLERIVKQISKEE